MSNKSEFVILRGPDIIDTGIPIVIATENYQENDVAVVESYTLIPKRKTPLFRSRLIYQGASLINMYSANHLYEEVIDTAKTRLKWHFIQTLDQNQKSVSPEIHSMKLGKINTDIDTKLFLLKDYNEQLEVIKNDTQCAALISFLKDLKGNIHGVELSVSVENGNKIRLGGLDVLDGIELWNTRRKNSSSDYFQRPGLFPLGNRKRSF